MGKDLLIACAVGDMKWAQLCVSKGASPKYTNNEGWSALHMAAMNTKIDCMKFLIENLKVDVDVTNGTGWTPLHLASRGKPEPAALDCVNYLISNGADVNKVNDMGISSVHQAVSANNTQCLSTLVKFGARVTCHDKRGLLPIDVAKVWGHSECSKYLQNVMWLEKKNEEDRLRKTWLLEHQQMLEEEIQKYTEAKNSDRVQKAYQCWVKDKGCVSPKLPYRCSARAKPLSCFKETRIPDLHKKQLSDKVAEQFPRAAQPNYSTTRLNLERVKKIQQLRKIITSRDVTTPPRDITAQLRDVSTEARDITTQLRNVTNNSTNDGPQTLRKKNYKSAVERQELQYRIARLSEPKTPPKRRRKRKKVKPQLPIPEPELPSTEFEIKVESYFKASPLSPDSGFVEAEELVEEAIEVTSVTSDKSSGSEKLLNMLGYTLQKSDISGKTVRFSDNVFYDTEYNSVSFGNNLEGLRSCIKVKQINNNHCRN